MDYVRAAGWKASDPKDPGGALQNGKGVCSALSAMYLGSRGDWSVFKNIISSSGGLAQVRGL